QAHKREISRMLWPGLVKPLHERRGWILQLSTHQGLLHASQERIDRRVVGSEPQKLRASAEAAFSALVGISPGKPLVDEISRNGIPPEGRGCEQLGYLFAIGDCLVLVR